MGRGLLHDFRPPDTGSRLLFDTWTSFEVSYCRRRTIFDSTRPQRMSSTSASSFRVDGVRAAGWARRRLSLAAGDASCGRPSRAVVTPFGWTILLRLGNVVLASHPPTPTPSPSTRGRSGSGPSENRTHVPIMSVTNCRIVPNI